MYYFLFIFIINCINYYKQIKKYYLQSTNIYIEQIIKFVHYFQFINLLILFYIYFTHIDIDHCNKICNIILYYIFILLFNIIIPKCFCIFIITNNEEIEELENYNYEEPAPEQEPVNDPELNNSNINIDINKCNILNNSKIIVLNDTNIINYANKICVICLENYIINETIIELKCNHEFHNNCCMLWFNNSTECPICRNNLI